MAHPHTPDDAPDRNLLFGILALQNNFINREALLAAFTTWVADKRRPLGEILCAQGKLTQLQDELLRALTEQQVKQHGNDPEQSLAALSSIGSVRADLQSIADTELQATLAYVARSAASIDATLDHPRAADDSGTPGRSSGSDWAQASTTIPPACWVS